MLIVELTDVTTGAVRARCGISESHGRGTARRRCSAAATATAAGHRRADAAAWADELHRLGRCARRRLLLDEGNAVRDPLGRRRVLEIVVVELLHADLHVVLIVVAGEAVSLALVRQ